MKTTLFLAGAVCALSSSFAWPDSVTQPSTPATASSHAPLGIMGDHRHHKGEFMFSYRFMHMDMQGSRVGSRRTSARQIVGTINDPGQFMVAPTSMPMDMHMFGVMYGLSNKVTIMGMTSLVNNEMDHLIRNGRTFTTEASGLGDTTIGAMIGLLENGNHKIHWNLSLSLPTGSTNERDDTPVLANAFLPYPMQLGSGTFDLLPGITYIGKQDQWRWGGQLSAVIRIGDNDQGYTLGDRFAATGWLSSDLSPQISTSLRFNFQNWLRVVRQLRVCLTLNEPIN